MTEQERPRFLYFSDRKGFVPPSVKNLLSSIGTVDVQKRLPLSQNDYPETDARVEVAFQGKVARNVAQGYCYSAIRAKSKRLRLQMQYNGCRKMFEKEQNLVAVAWNGLIDKARVFMDAAKDSGARTLFFELSPIPGCVTVDPQGVNYANSLPRKLTPYLAWSASSNTDKDWRQFRGKFESRKPIKRDANEYASKPITEKYIFVPLQIPDDTQLFLFGGAFATVESVIIAAVEVAKNLPEGWHVRLKEHPSSTLRFAKMFQEQKHHKVVLDNTSNTFELVANAQCIVTVNSSVGLQSMFYEKPVIALGQCFWAIDGVAQSALNSAALFDKLKHLEHIGFDPVARESFLSYLVNEYYLPFSCKNKFVSDSNNTDSKILSRLNSGFQF